jgi:hypothetical protein
MARKASIEQRALAAKALRVADEERRHSLRDAEIRAARAQERQSLKVWDERYPAGMPLPTSIFDNVHATAVVQAALDAGAGDICIDYRPGQSEARLRVDGAGKIIEPEANWSAKNVCKAFYGALKNPSGNPYSPTENQGAGKTFDVGDFSIYFRYQAMPVYPAGFTVVLRVMPSRRLTPEQAADRDASQAAWKAFVSESFARHAAKEPPPTLSKDTFDLNAMLCDCAGEGDLHGLRCALEQGADPLWLDERLESKGRSALMRAANKGDLECVKALFEKSDIDAVDFEGQTSFMLAARAGALDCVKFIAPFSEPDDCEFADGRTALMQACWISDVEMARFLASISDVNLVSRDGRSTALWLAAQEDEMQIVKILVAAGADPRFVDANGLGLIENAQEHGSDKVARLLRKQAKMLDEREAISEAAKPGPSRRVLPL